MEAARELAAKFVIRVDQILKDWDGFGNKQSGALRRLSLDLTWALAEMRKP